MSAMVLKVVLKMLIDTTNCIYISTYSYVDQISVMPCICIT